MNEEEVTLGVSTCSGLPPAHDRVVIQLTFLHRLSGDAFLVDRFVYQSTRLGKLGLST